MIWISVKDRLPEKSGKYRVRTIEGSIAPRVGECWVFGKITHDGFRFLEGDWQRVTHWAEEAQINNPCGHTGFESNVCEICGYPDPSKMIAKLKDRCAGYCNGQEQLQSILSGVMDSNAKWAEEVATLNQQVKK